MRLRYAGVCRVCGVTLPAKAEAVYERASKTVRCVTHDCSELVDTVVVDDAQGVGAGSSGPIDVGTPGASARREFERRRTRREQRIHEAHPKLGGLIHALSDDPLSTKAWDVGAAGEERLGRRLNELAGNSLQVLHDRRIPGTRANVDHIAVTPTGVYVIDTKRYRGRPHLEVEGGLLRPRVEKLLVGARNCTPIVDGVLKQLAVVREHVDESTPVHGVLCFVEADWPLIGGSFSTRGVEALWPKKLYKTLKAAGPLNEEDIATLHRALASALPSA